MILTMFLVATGGINSEYAPSGRRWRCQGKRPDKVLLRLKYLPKLVDLIFPQIRDEKLDWDVGSRIRSLENVKHKVGGGDKKIFDDKEYLRFDTIWMIHL